MTYCPIPIAGHWHLEDSPEGWFVVRPFDNGRMGPFTEAEAGQLLPKLREQYPDEVRGCTRQ